MSKKENNKKYYQTHKEEFKKYYQEHKAEIAEHLNTKIGRASNLLGGYKKADKFYNRGECTLTPEWIAENIFTKPCVHCGETDWHKIGCNRLDNSKPHTPDNVEPCCHKCNIQLGVEERKRKVYQYALNNELVKVWNSAKDTIEDGFTPTHVTACCQGKHKVHKGYHWSYLALE